MAARCVAGRWQEVILQGQALRRQISQCVTAKRIATWVINQQFWGAYETEFEVGSGLRLRTVCGGYGRRTSVFSSQPGLAFQLGHF